MANNGVVKPQGPTGAWANPWVVIGGGLALVIVALVVPAAAKVFFLFPGLLGIGAAVWMRLAWTEWELEDRARSAGLLTLAGLGSGLAASGFGQAGWDSFAIVGAAGVGVALAGALLVLMPPLARRLAITVLVLIHFLGILTAVTSVPPPNGGNSPFLVNVAWTYFYRNYLQFMYLNNAYHFYSPDPGPPSLLWFAIDYEKGHPRWVMLPRADQYRTRQDYQRYLALAEYSSPSAPAPPFPGPVFDEMWKLRVKQGANLNIPAAGEEFGIPRNVQFQFPLTYTKHMVASYARYVAQHFPSNLGPEDRVKSVKVYRVKHNILSPEQFANIETQKWSVTGPETYVPFYLGEFDAEGKLTRGLPVFNPLTGQQMNPLNSDPFLYWAMVPGWTPRDPGHPSFPPMPRTHESIDYTEIHFAGNDPDKARYTKKASLDVYGESPGH